mmetsp:Transcript_23735/g.45249  ORF Transcript_23735/g.45249 Transcript_23735/m.45249 type:complete len:202 (-) Transcript_23735:206-811(-)
MQTTRRKPPPPPPQSESRVCGRPFRSPLPNSPLSLPRPLIDPRTQTGPLAVSKPPSFMVTVDIHLRSADVRIPSIGIYSPAPAGGRSDGASRIRVYGIARLARAIAVRFIPHVRRARPRRREIRIRVRRKKRNLLVFFSERMLFFADGVYIRVYVRPPAPPPSRGRGVFGAYRFRVWQGAREREGEVCVRACVLAKRVHPE